MIPLGSGQTPLTLADWQDRIAHLFTSRVSGGIRCTLAGRPPGFDALDADLSGGRLSDAPPPDVVVVGRVEAGPSVDRVSVVAHPLVARRVPVSFELSAGPVQFGLGRNGAGHLIATVVKAADGRLSARLAAADLDAALLAAVQAGAAEHGVDVRAAHAEFTARSPRDLDVVLDLTVRKFVTFPLRIAARVAVDDLMTLTVTGATVDGTGMAARAASAILRPLLAKVAGRPYPLATLGPVRLQDVQVDVADGFQITAAFAV